MIYNNMARLNIGLLLYFNIVISGLVEFISFSNYK